MLSQPQNKLGSHPLSLGFPSPHCVAPFAASPFLGSCFSVAPPSQLSSASVLLPMPPLRGFSSLVSSSPSLLDPCYAFLRPPLTSCTSHTPLPLGVDICIYYILLDAFYSAEWGFLTSSSPLVFLQGSDDPSKP